MFTGLIEDVGTIDAVSTGPAGRELRIRSRFDSLADGESIAVNGACLTVREHGPGVRDLPLGSPHQRDAGVSCHYAGTYS